MEKKNNNNKYFNSWLTVASLCAMQKRFGASLCRAGFQSNSKVKVTTGTGGGGEFAASSCRRFLRPHICLNREKFSEVEQGQV